MDNNLLTASNVAEYLGVSLKTIQRWEKKGVLTAHKTPGGQRRYIKDHVDKLLKSNQDFPNEPLKSKEHDIYDNFKSPVPKHMEKLFTKTLWIAAAILLLIIGLKTEVINAKPIQKLLIQGLVTAHFVPPSCLNL